MKTLYLIAFAVILILTAVMQCNRSFAQTTDEEFMIANTQYDSIGTLFCYNSSRLPCDSAYTIRTYIIGWKLMYVRYERSYDYMTAWIPIYKSEFINLNPIK